MAKIPPYPTSLVFRRRGINTIFSFYILTQIYIIRKTSNRVNGFFENNYKKFLCFSARFIIYPFYPVVNGQNFPFSFALRFLRPDQPDCTDSIFPESSFICSSGIRKLGSGIAYARGFCYNIHIWAK